MARRSAVALVEFANLPRASFDQAWVRTARRVVVLGAGELGISSFRGAISNELATLRREIRTALGLITGGGDPRPLVRRLNRSGCLGWQLVAAPEGETGTGPGWRITWAPPTPRSMREAFVQALATTLTIADRIGRCEQCRCFFLRKKQHRQRFCTEGCSTTFHNKSRRESGYFQARRLAKRRRDAASGQDTAVRHSSA